jgi:lipoprotein LprG
MVGRTGALMNRIAAGMTRRLPGLLALVLVAVSVTGCGSDAEELPEAKPLLQQAARAMTGIETVRFKLDVDGTISGLTVKQAEGIMTRGGEVSATADVAQAGELVQYEYVLAEGAAYLKGPTGGFRPLPPRFATLIYNPTKLLDDSSGLRRTLADAQDAETEAAETVDGLATYRIRASMSTEPLQGVSALPAGQQRLDSVLWIDQDSRRLVRLRVPFKPSGSDEQVVFTVRLSNFNEPADIKPPQT